MQDKKSNFVKKLNSLHTQTGWTWDEIAKALDVSKSKLFYVKRGERDPAESMVYRLDELIRSTNDIRSHYQNVQGCATLAEPAPQWLNSESPEADLEQQRIETRFQAIESKLDAIFVVLSELRNAQKKDFRSSETPPLRYPRGQNEN